MFELDYSELFQEEDLKAVTDLIKSGKVCGWWGQQQGGEYVHRFENRMKIVTGLNHAKAVSSGTASIYLALRALGVQKGDAVITTAYNHIGGVAPITLNGSTPFFVDVDQYGNMDYGSFVTAVNTTLHSGMHPPTDPTGMPWAFGGALKTAAVIITHSLGQPCADTRRIVKKAHDHDMVVIEDCSQALGSSIDHKPVGSFGDVACYSTGGDMTKMITTGEGGVIATDIGYIADAIDNLRNHGDKQGAIYPCFNFRMSDLQALLGWITLKTLDKQLTTTKVNADYLINSLKETWQFFDPPKDTTPSYYILKFTPAGPLADPGLAVEKVEKLFGPPKPRMAVSRGYRTALNEIPVNRGCPQTSLLMTKNLMELSLWVDWMRWPHRRETMTPLIDALKDVF